MTAALPESFTSGHMNAPSWADSSVAIGDFLFLPASSAGGINGSLKGVGGVIALTWSAPTLEEFVTAMAQLEQEFLSAWRDAGLPTPAQGRTVQHHHA
ncbi:hypothetical protein J7E93_32320 [Streptomyces sp. ISL-36]|uniref:hypothetical protein n=1 Tax=Streptomyces sp. ISL-36 TaxID=2819182 RepID=UPI001BEB3FF8|nr:hypothetical protein [Streptomyces sp. ISL-36]MBT2444699.1 hypothetical protein [Streptomyces sp. ISL-36]